MNILAKRRKIEEKCEKVILATKAKTLEDELVDVEEEAEVEEDKEKEDEVDENMKCLLNEVSKRAVTDVQNLTRVLKPHVGK